jgi:hypothetical protein
VKLLKVKNGLLEAENFFLVSSFSDFAGSTHVSRDIATGKMRIMSNDKIERPFVYNEFVIEVEKENFLNLEINDYSMIYLGDENHNFGIKDQDDVTSQNRYWKILKQDNYIQAFSSPDGINYINIGGMEYLDSITKQGFMKYTAEDFILNNYKVYSSPYVTIQNFPENTLCEMYDLNNNLIKSRTFDSAMECKVYLDSNSISSYFKFKDINNNVLYTSEAMDLGYGDTWVFSPYNFEIIYLGNVVTNVNPSLLQDLDEVIALKNTGTTDYFNITIGTQTSGNDLIQLSLDGITFTDTLTLDIAQNEIRDIGVRIIKNVDNNSFKIRDFELVINE